MLVLGQMSSGNQRKVQGDVPVPAPLPAECMSMSSAGKRKNSCVGERVNGMNRALTSGAPAFIRNTVFLISSAGAPKFVQLFSA